jgi:hypothetical protein
VILKACPVAVKTAGITKIRIMAIAKPIPISKKSDRQFCLDFAGVEISVEISVMLFYPYSTENHTKPKELCL